MQHSSSMARKSSSYLIKRLQTELPRGTLFGFVTLESFGVSANLAAYYVQSGLCIWLMAFMGCYV